MLERNKNNSKTKIVGNDTVFGQIATYMENLHLSYSEVLEVIPYRNILAMQQDKLREATGELVQKVSSRELFGNKIKG